MIRAPELPFLPGYSINTNVGQTNFHRSQHFEYIHEGVPYLSDKARFRSKVAADSADGAYPSVYARGEVIELPPWLAFDKHILAFDGYYVESLQSTALDYSYAVHHVKVFFFLEDGTIKVVEPQLMNSGSPQGCLIKRQRIQYADQGTNDDFYDIIDFNIGKELQFFGKNITLTNCDVFTRTFLNRLGIPVCDPIPVPEDPYMTHRQELDSRPKKKKVNLKETVGTFLKADNRILCFSAFWDDRATEYGYLHLLNVYYYLVDDTMEIQDVTDSENPFLIVKRSRLPKEYGGLPPPGENESCTILNVLGGPREKSRYLIDPLGMGLSTKKYYSERDIAIGAVLCSYGRRFVIVSCDPFTQDYYRMKYGIDDFTPFPRPPTYKEQQIASTKNVELVIPPYNGFGSYEDSVLNCLTVNPSEIVKVYTQFYEKDRQGYDSRILRFSAQMIKDNELGDQRKFVICYYLSDDTLTIHDEVPRNSGYTGGKLISRRKILKPGQNIYGNKPHEYISYKDLYVGNVIILEEFTFYIDGADEYAFKYMEQHPSEFPKSNIRLVMDKLQTGIKPVYKEFAAQFVVDGKFPPVNYATFRNALKNVMGNKIDEQEIITIARYYAHKVPRETLTMETIQRLAHDILRRELFINFDNLRAGFIYFDPDRKGHVNRDTAYRVLRGAKVPLDVELIKLILEKAGRGENCEIDYNQLVDFLNYREFEVRPIPPINISGTLSWMNLCRQEILPKIDTIIVAGFLEELKLEKELKCQT